MTGSVETMPPGADLFASGCAALVDPVDLTGAQGKGLALKFKQRFPAPCAIYKGACLRHEPHTGRVYLVGSTDAGVPTVVFFPSKRHYRDASRIGDMLAGLVDMERRLAEIDIRSVAIPALGCGEGGLAWTDVEPLLLASAERMAAAGMRVKLYPPHEAAPRTSP